MKLNPLPEIIKGKSVAVIDDSIVRGSTAKKLVQRLRKSGVKEVHLLISSPPVLYPDYYGIDTPNQDDLIASKLVLNEIIEYLQVDSLYFLSFKGLIKAIGLSEIQLCTSCFTGEYPVDLGERKNEISKHTI